MATSISNLLTVPQQKQTPSYFSGNGLLSMPKSAAPKNPDWNAINVKPVAQPVTPPARRTTFKPTVVGPQGSPYYPPANTNDLEKLRGQVLDLGSRIQDVADTKNSTLFPNIASSLVKTSTQGSPQLQDATQGLIDIGRGDSPAVAAATANIKQLAEQNANEKYRIAGLPIGAADQAGREANLDLLYSAKNAAAQTALQNALQGQSQRISSLSSGASAAQSGQSLQQSGLTSAANLAPDATRFSTFGGPSFDLGSIVNSYKQQVEAGTMSPAEAESKLQSLVGGFGPTALNQALNGYNYVAGNATAQGRAGVVQNIPIMEAAETQADGIRQKIDLYLQQNPDLNQNPVNAANAVDQWAKTGQFSDPKYKTLINYLQEYANTIAPILGVGGSVTNLKTEIAQRFIDETAQGASISQVLGNLSNLAKGKIQDAKSGAFGGGTVSNPITPSSGGSQYQSSSGKKYVLPY